MPLTKVEAVLAVEVEVVGAAPVDRRVLRV